MDAPDRRSAAGRTRRTDRVGCARQPSTHPAAQRRNRETRSRTGRRRWWGLGSLQQLRQGRDQFPLALPQGPDLGGEVLERLGLLVVAAGERGHGPVDEVHDLRRLVGQPVADQRVQRDQRVGERINPVGHGRQRAGQRRVCGDADDRRPFPGEDDTRLGAAGLGVAAARTGGARRSTGGGLERTGSPRRGGRGDVLGRLCLGRRFLLGRAGRAPGRRSALLGRRASRTRPRRCPLIVRRPFQANVQAVVTVGLGHRPRRYRTPRA